MYNTYIITVGYKKLMDCEINVGDPKRAKRQSFGIDVVAYIGAMN